MRKYTTPEIVTCILNTNDVIATSDLPRLSEGVDGATNYGKLNRYINGR